MYIIVLCVCNCVVYVIVLCVCNSRPDIFLAKLSQNPVRKTFAENPALAQEMGQDESAEFYFVKAEPISAKFSAARSGSTSQVGGATGESKPPRPLSRKFLHKASGKGRDYV